MNGDYLDDSVFRLQMVIGYDLRIYVCEWVDDMAEKLWGLEKDVAFFGTDISYNAVFGLVERIRDLLEDFDNHMGGLESASAFEDARKIAGAFDELDKWVALMGDALRGFDRKRLEGDYKLRWVVKDILHDYDHGFVKYLRTGKEIRSIVERLGR